jgi:hypothetical protein
MIKIPKLLYSVAIVTLITSNLFAGVVLPTVANSNAQLSAGIRSEADFDWSSTNIFNNKNYFETASNFFTDESSYFRSDGQHGRIDWDPDSNAFLNAKKMQINHNKHGKVLKSFAANDILSAGHKGYNQFGNSKSYSLGSDNTVTGMGAGTGNGNEKFEIFGGSTGSAMNVEISFRSKSNLETWGNHKTNHDETSPIGGSPLVGNVMRLHGMGIQAASTDGRVKTNPFVLASNYTQADFDATYSLTELEELINGCLFLGWLNTSIDGDITSVGDGDRWVHAVQGNYDNMPDNPNRHHEHGVIGQAIIGTVEEYIAGTTTSIAGLEKEAGTIRVGDHGGDPETNVVWAAIDHNSDFAVVPEPSTYALIAGVISLAFVAFRRHK